MFEAGIFFNSQFQHKFPSMEGWHEVPGWFQMIPFQKMLPEVYNFGFALFFCLNTKEPKSQG
jgi:hypothetical protein